MFSKPDDYVKTQGLPARGYVLFMLFLVSTFNYVDRYLLSITVEPIKAEFALNDTQMGILGGIAFAMLYATMGVPIARWADRGNRSTIVALAVAVWSTMTAFTALVTNYWQLLLARVGVGIGEAGAAPPSHSLISEYFPPAQRGRAIAVFSFGTTSGYLLAFLLGSWITATYGWRMAFIAFGLPGIALALLVKLTVREPRIHRITPLVAQSSFVHSMGDLWRNRTFRYLCIAYALSAISAYGAAQWFPAFMMRTHSVSLTEMGLKFGLILATSATAGIFLGGFMSDHLTRVAIKWLPLYPAIIALVIAPFSFLSVMTDSIDLFFVIAFFGNLATNLVLPAILASLHTALANNQRATGIAVSLFFLNFVGMGVGPILVGAVSDVLQPTHGVDSLRYGLAASYAIALLHIFPLFAASRTIESDSQRASAADHGVDL